MQRSVRPHKLRVQAEPVAQALKKIGDDVYQFMKASDASREAVLAVRFLLRRIGTSKMYTGGLSWSHLKRERREREAADN